MLIPGVITLSTIVAIELDFFENEEMKNVAAVLN